MNFCPQCGTAKVGNFCGGCGFNFLTATAKTASAAIGTESNVPSSAEFELPKGLEFGSKFKTGKNCVNCGKKITKDNRCSDCGEN